MTFAQVSNRHIADVASKNLIQLREGRNRQVKGFKYRVQKIQLKAA